MTTVFFPFLEALKPFIDFLRPIQAMKRKFEETKEERLPFECVSVTRKLTFSPAQMDEAKNTAKNVLMAGLLK